MKIRDFTNCSPDDDNQQCYWNSKADSQYYIVIFSERGLRQMLWQVLYIMLSHFILTKTHKVIIIIIPILQKRKINLREVK
jgi:hypothetical protein